MRISDWSSDVCSSDLLRVWLAQPDALRPAAAQQWLSLQRLGVVAERDRQPGDGADLLLDGLLGYRLRGQPGARFAELIVQANAADVPIVAMDLPSGLDPDDGRFSALTISAAATLTLAAPKPGVLAAAARAFCCARGGWVIGCAGGRGVAAGGCSCKPMPPTCR